MTVTVHHGDCLAILPTLPADSVHACVTDPPYHLTSIVDRFGAKGAAPAKSNGATGVYKRASAGFMGQRWDGGDVAFRPETWAQVLRVMKPGAHLVAFSAPRTVHLMATAIEAAGFEIRDRFLELVDIDPLVTAFLESLDEAQRDAFGRLVQESVFGGELAWLFGSGFPKSHNVSKAIDKAAGLERPIVATERVRDIRNGHGRAPGEGIHASGHEGPAVYMDRAVTTAASAASAAWEGWGTALKPAYEPIIVARKPLAGTVVQAVLAHGTGALNIDGCRVEGVGVRTFDRAAGDRSREQYRTGTVLPGSGRQSDAGRWPANVLHDGSDAVVSAFPGAPGQMRPVRGDEASTRHVYGEFGSSPASAPRGDVGSAARFFYSSKADADDRLGSKHPTVKPTDLMAWLCRLITPPGGVVLDPFAGSGSTGMACLREGFDAVLIEREAQYIADIRRRIAHVSGLDAPLFGGTPADTPPHRGRRIYGVFADEKSSRSK